MLGTVLRRRARLSLEKAWEVWKVANDDERKQLRPILEAKAKRRIENRVPSEREALKARVRAALSEKKGAAEASSMDAKKIVGSRN